VAILLNAEWDHPDVFADEAAVLDAFEAWVRTMVPDASGRQPTLIVDAAGAGAAAVATRLADWPGTIVRVGLGQDGGQSDGALRDSALDLQGRLVARGPNGIELEVEGRLLSAVNDGQRRMRVPLALPGRHNAANAVCVIAAALVLGIAPADVAATIGSYRGVGRRLELKGEPDGVLVLDDYAHHPSAIRATLAAVREAYPGRPVWAVYEPLTYHRTAAMLDAFAEVLSTADRAVIADIWAGRDPDRTVVSAADLAEAISARGSQPALATGSPEATADRLAELVRPEDIVLVMGGGRSYVIAERLVTRLAERPSSRPTSAA